MYQVILVSSIKERIYCIKNDEIYKAGVLIYTTSNDLQGGLGGLVQHAESKRFEKLLTDAINNISWCSLFDPICSNFKEHNPRSSTYAACHNCLLLP